MKSTRWILLGLTVAAISGAVVWRVKAVGAKPETAAPTQAAPISVITAEVTVRDVPFWLSGLGTVQAYNTVIVRPRVGGIVEGVDFTEGAMVEKGEVLARIDPRPYRTALTQAKALKARTEAQLAAARLELKRAEGLVKSTAGSQKAMEQAAATVGELEAQLQGDEATIDTAEINLEYTNIRAPIAGRTGIRQLDAGNVVTANQEQGLVTLTQLQPITVLFTLPQQQLPSLSAHMKPGAAALPVQTLGEDGGVIAQGKLELIDNQIDASTGTMKLKAGFANDDLSLWPGQFVSARALVETRKDATVVPREAVQPGLDGPYAYFIKEDSTVEARSLRVGPTVEGWTIIEEGLKPGDLVVKDGQSKLKPGALVKAREVKL